MNHTITIAEPDFHNDIWKDIRQQCRLGKFYIHDYILMEYPGEVQTLLSTMFVHIATRDCVAARVKYVALAPYFEPLEVGTTAPEYLVTFHQDDGQQHWLELAKV